MFLFVFEKELETWIENIKLLSSDEKSKLWNRHRKSIQNIRKYLNELERLLLD